MINFSWPATPIARAAERSLASVASAEPDRRRTQTQPVSRTLHLQQAPDCPGYLKRPPEDSDAMASSLATGRPWDHEGRTSTSAFWSQAADLVRCGLSCELHIDTCLQCPRFELGAEAGHRPQKHPVH